MSALSDFFISEPSGVPVYDGGQNFPDEDKCQLRRFSPLEAAGLLVSLRGSGDRVEEMDSFQLLTPEDAEEWTMTVPDEFTTLLSQLPEDVSEAALRTANVTAEELGWTKDDFVPVLTQLRNLARRAIQYGKKIYFWFSI